MATNISETQVQISYTAEELENAVAQAGNNALKLQTLINDTVEGIDTVYSSAKIGELLKELADRITALETNGVSIESYND